MSILYLAKIPDWCGGGTSRSAVASYPGVQLGYEARLAAAASIAPSMVWPLNWWHALHCAPRPHPPAVAVRVGRSVMYNGLACIIRKFVASMEQLNFVD